MRWFNQNNLKTSINVTFVPISPRAHVNNLNYNTKAYSILNSTRSLKMR